MPTIAIHRPEPRHEVVGARAIMPSVIAASCGSTTTKRNTLSKPSPSDHPASADVDLGTAWLTGGGPSRPAAIGPGERVVGVTNFDHRFPSHQRSRENFQGSVYQPATSARCCCGRGGGEAV